MTDETISHYKVLGELGRGGMGLVYKAEDTRLDRTVALKVLPGSALVTDDDRSRFYREARAAASLHHPNIATVFEIDEYDRGGDSGPYIAMEFIDGDTLAERIAKGPVPLEDVISIGASTARALKAAHDKAIVHRDIKSANIMLNNAGDVKVLDFGLAKLSESSLLTQQGTTLGTIAYMSPEQARGKGIDHQSDIWSLGVVLYEMISGQLPFQGDYSEATIYAILNNNPKPLTALRTGVPMDLERIVFKCLAKDKSLRYQNVDEIPADLAAVNFDMMSSSSISAYLTTPAATVSSPPAAAPSKKKILPLAAGAAAIAVVGALIGWFAKPAPVPDAKPVTRYVIELPIEEQMLPDEDSYSAIAISRDGQSIVYLGGTRGSLFWRRLDQLESEVLPGTDYAARPFFSPDGSEIAFFKRRLGSPSLYTLDLAGGAPIFLTDDVNANFRDAIWLDDGTIAYTDRDCDVSRISPQNGERQKLVARIGDELCLAPLLTDHSDPGTLLLRTSDGETAEMSVADVPSGKRIGNHKSFPWHYINGGYYAYMDIAATFDGSGLSSLQLLLAPFDLEKLEFRGRPILVEGGNLDYGHVAFSFEGSFVYLKSGRKGEMVWIDRDGTVSSAEDEVPSGFVGDPQVSPDGRRIALVKGSPSTGFTLNIVDRRTRRTSELLGAGGVIWMPDGSIVYSECSAYPRCSTLRTSADLSRQPDTLIDNQSLFATSVSEDGRMIMLTDFGGRVSKLKLLDLEIGEVNLLLDEVQGTFGGVFAPDGEWYGHMSIRNGNAELLVSRVDGEASILINRNPTSFVDWSPTRSELYYWTAKGMMAATYEIDGDDFTITSEEMLFEVGGPPTMGFDYDPASERFLVARSDPSVADSILVVRNYIAEIERAYE